MCNRKKSIILLAVFVAAVFALMAIANGIQHGNGTIDISEGFIDAAVGDAEGKLYYKLYVPKTASEAAPAPGVLLLHGYQNDHETCAAYAIELARRGAVVLVIDEYGHGVSSLGLVNRGYVNHKVTVNYGEDSEADGTFKSIGGATRYRIMMNFSNLSFFNKKYSTDTDGNVLTDSSCGGIAGYAFLADLPYVDSTRLGLSGHSMGTWSSWSVAAAYSGTDIEPKATVLQCGELFRDSACSEADPTFENVLLLQARYDEFSYFRDYKKTVNDDLLKSDLRTEFLGTDAANAAWNTTFGDFADGSARRIELLETNHRLTTHNKHGLATAIDWFDSTLGLPDNFDAYDQIAMTKEVLVLAAMLCAIVAMFPLMELLLTVPFFKKVVQPLPDAAGAKSGKQWWKGAIVTMLISFATYPFMTQLGHGLMPLPEGVFRMTVGNGLMTWYLLLILVMLAFVIADRVKAKKHGGDASYLSMGLAEADKPDKLSWKLMGRSALLACCMLALMYLLVFLCEKLFKLDFRFIWPFFKAFTCERFLQFLVYILIFATFFVLNNSRIMASSRCAATYEKGIKGYFGCWWRNALMMVGGVLLVVLLEYIPFFLGIGPGADVLFGSTFGGPFMSLLILFAPQVVVFSFIGTYVYRRTGNVYTGAFTIAALACWIVTGGSSMM